MTKKFLIFALCLFILSTFISACGGGGKTTPPNSPFFPIPTPTPAKYSLELSQTEFTVNIGETDNITVTLNGEDITQTATYTVDQEAIATVEAGLITGISVGIATVTVHAENAEADKTFTVNVIDPTLPNLEVNPTEVDLLIDEQGAVTVTLEGKDVTEDVTYTVDDKSIATVEKGKITGIDEGTTNVKVSLEGANSAVFKVNVTDDSDKEVTLNDEVLAQLGYQKVKNTPYYDIKKIEDGTIVTNLEIPATFQDNENKKCKIIAIGNNAFNNCDSLQSVTFGENSNLESIGDYAFNNCTSLESVTIPDSVTHIGDSAFYDCGSLQSVTIGSGLTAIGQIFTDCYNLENVTVSDNVLCIFPEAFKNCTNLTQLTTKNGTKIDIPDSGVRKNNNVTFIDVKTKSDITAVTIPDGVTEIPNNVFMDYTLLTNITLPNSVKLIDNSAIKNCTLLKIITLPNGVTTIGNQAFYNSGYSNNTANLKLKIPDSVTSIGSQAFYNLAEITYDPTKMKATGKPWGAKKVNGVEQ